MRGSPATSGADRAVRIVFPEAHWEVAGAVLMELLGPFERQDRPKSDGDDGEVALVFYPGSGTPTKSACALSSADIVAALPSELRSFAQSRVEIYDVPRDWVDGWRDHFQPVSIGGVRIRPPWAAPLHADGTREVPARGGPILDMQAGRGRSLLTEVVINPGLGFGTGHHPTTRGTLRLLQKDAGRPRGALVDVGSGSGILAVAAARLGWRPVVAFDNDPVALQSALENIRINGVAETVTALVADLADAPSDWFADATVLVNMTLEPVAALLRKVAASPHGAVRGIACVPGPRRLVVSGILEGAQERMLLSIADQCGFAPGLRGREDGWVSLELLPALGEE